jgi:hypothetical protein
VDTCYTHEYYGYLYARRKYSPSYICCLHNWRSAVTTSSPSISNSVVRSLKYCLDSSQSFQFSTKINTPTSACFLNLHRLCCIFSHHSWSLPSLSAYQYMLHFLSVLSKAFHWPSILALLLNLFCFLLNPAYFNNTVVSLKYINFHDLQAWVPLLTAVRFLRVLMPPHYDIVAIPSWNMATAARMFNNYHLPAYRSHHTLNCTIFGTKLLNIKRVFSFLLHLVPETCLILRTTKWDIIMNVHRSSCQVPIILVRF